MQVYAHLVIIRRAVDWKAERFEAASSSSVKLGLTALAVSMPFQD